MNLPSLPLSSLVSVFNLTFHQRGLRSRQTFPSDLNSTSIKGIKSVLLVRKRRGSRAPRRPVVWCHKWHWLTPTTDVRREWPTSSDSVNPNWMCIRYKNLFDPSIGVWVIAGRYHWSLDLRDTIADKRHKMTKNAPHWVSLSLRSLLVDLWVVWFWCFKINISTRSRPCVHWGLLRWVTI